MIDAVAGWAAAHPIATVLAVGVLLTVGFALASRPSPPPGYRQRLDPQRGFSSGQRRAGFERCGHRCEGEWLPGVRCRRSATAGDHWFPHSRGGATSMQNFVGLCRACNRRKTNRIPTRAATLRLIMRRRRYWPPGVPIEPGAWR